MHDQEGRAAKRRLLQTGEYAIRIIKLLGTEAALEAWIHYKITKAADYISSVYHYMMGEKALDQMNETEEYIQMSASQLYKTAKYSAKLIRIIEDDQELKDWIQVKIGKAATHLSEVYHYIDFEDASSMEAIEQQKIDKFHTDLDKLVHKTFGPSSDEKKMTKEGSRMPSSMIQHKQKLDAMSPEEINAFFQKRADFFKKPAKELARQQELRFGKKVAAMAPYSRHVQEYSDFKNKVLKKIRGPVDLIKQRQDREAQADKMATLQNISKDKHTPYDQELKDKLAARLDKLRSTGL